MNLAQLQYFVSLAEKGHISEAAKELFVAQSTLSNSIKSLENEIGATLFDHATQGFTLTASGKIFYRYIKHALSTISEGKLLALNPDIANSDTIVLGIDPYVRKEYARVAIEAYKDDVGKNDAKFITVIEQCNSVIDGLRRGAIDAGMVLSEIDVPDLICEKVGKYNLAAVFNKHHPLMSEHMLSIKDISKYAIISYHPSSPLATQLKPIFETYDIQIARYFEDDSALCGELCRDNTVVALMRSTTEINLYPKLAFRPIEEVSDCLFGTYFVAKKPPHRTDDVEQFISYISTVHFPNAERIIQDISL